MEPDPPSSPPPRGPRHRRRKHTVHRLAHNGRVNDVSFAPLLTAEGRALLDEVRDHRPGTGTGRRHPAAPRPPRRTGLGGPRPGTAAAAGGGEVRGRGRRSGCSSRRTGSSSRPGRPWPSHRAERLRALGVRSVADLCCGIGGDAIALARAGIRVLAVDRDPLTAAVARANADALGLADLIEVREADVTRGRHRVVRRRLRGPGAAGRPGPDLRPRGVLAAAVLGGRGGPARPRSPR